MLKPRSVVGQHSQHAATDSPRRYVSVGNSSNMAVISSRVLNFCGLISLNALFVCRTLRKLNRIGLHLPQFTVRAAGSNAARIGPRTEKDIPS
ncbi:hypothetical protein E2C01_056391 [Portunus trituberculatus]|uniref:Uncharacterized protein n=1 Tax=Portunus trituberculatus TaxID=210409 RepID=A0A5B7GZ10_PORTR|nr:hypothetical protein [Portunus trituberculatus]